MDKEFFQKWLVDKITELEKFKPTDNVNKAYMEGAILSLSEVLMKVTYGRFDKS